MSCAAFVSLIGTELNEIISRNKIVVINEPSSGFSFVQPHHQVAETFNWLNENALVEFVLQSRSKLFLWWRRVSQEVKSSIQCLLFDTSTGLFRHCDAEGSIPSVESLNWRSRDLHMRLMRGSKLLFCPIASIICLNKQLFVCLWPCDELETSPSLQDASGSLFKTLVVVCVSEVGWKDNVVENILKCKNKHNKIFKWNVLLVSI